MGLEITEKRTVTAAKRISHKELLTIHDYNGRLQIMDLKKQELIRSFVRTNPEVIELCAAMDSKRTEYEEFLLQLFASYEFNPDEFVIDGETGRFQSKAKNASK
jgi:hypothetical protein